MHPYYINDPELNPNNVVFWWTPKCGCIFVRKLYHLLTRYNGETYDINENDMDKYIHILFVRNPYKRIVSGYIDCYVTDHQPVEIFNEELSFKELVEELLLNEFKNVDKLHFDHQISIKDANISNKLSINKIFDIESIDYSLLSKLFNDVLISDDIINSLRNNGHNVKYLTDFSDNVSDYKISQFNDFTGYPKYQFFYTKELVDKIESFYDCDFLFLEQNGIKYIPPL